MRHTTGIALIVIGSLAALVLGFRALMLGGGSSAQAQEALLSLGGAGAAVIAAVYGGSLVATRAQGDED